MFSLAVILYRVATFNNCQSAAEELQAVTYNVQLMCSKSSILYVMILQEIKEARTALQKKGFKFDWYFNIYLLATTGLTFHTNNVYS